MSDIVDLNSFRKPMRAEVPAAAQQPRSVPASPVEGLDDEGRKLTKPGVDFRKRFVAALETMRDEAATQRAAAKTASDVTIRINVSAVLKRAKSSPLAAYSPLHRKTLIPLVEEAAEEHRHAMSKLFKRQAAKPSVAALKAQLKKEREAHASAISTLASQKLVQFLLNHDNR